MIPPHSHYSARATKVLMNGRIKVHQFCTVRRPAEEVYEFWKNPFKLVELMPRRVSVEVASEVEARWKARGPVGLTVRWTSLLVNDESGRLIAWRSPADSNFMHAGCVRFEPLWNNEATLLTITVEYEPPAGKLGEFFVRLTRWDPETAVAEFLRRVKTTLEFGQEQPQGDGPLLGSPSPA